MVFRKHLSALALLVSVTALAAAQEDRPKPADPKQKPQQLDKEFMEKANRANLMEIAMGRLAGTKAENAEVKEFGRRMVTDHEAMNTELSDLAARKSIKLPGELTKDQQKMIDDMGKTSGKEFDKQFMNHMVSDHEKAVELFRSTSTSAQDPDIKSLAAGALPKLESHLKEAKALRDKVAGRETDKPKPDKPAPDKPKPDKP